MFGSTILDVAIALVFVYLLLSLVCSSAKEIVEGWLGHRASDLEGALKDLLGAALAWARARPFKAVTVAHRASNIASQRSILRQGFVLVQRVADVWPDGAVEDALQYSRNPGD